MKKLLFFLGGMDAEMVQIEMRLREAGASFSNKGLGWGAHASAYATEIAQAVAEGKVIVLVELDNHPHEKTGWAPEKVPVELPAGSIEVDHHNERAGEPAAILQVLDLLGVEPNRHDSLIAANDENFIFGMQAIGATAEEIADIRALDRAAQGVTDEQEVEAVRAISQAETTEGKLTVVHMAHSKCSPVTDRLFGLYRFLLIISGDGEINFYASSADEADKAIISVTAEKFPGGWIFGGGTGWGAKLDQVAVESFIREQVG